MDLLEARLREALAGPEPPRGGEPPGASAVLLPLYPAGPSLLFTRRAATLATHPGQMSFPGGRLEPGEAPLAAALRETEEEVGVPRAHVAVVGHLEDYVTHYGRLVCAFVGLVEPGAPAPRVTSPEVKEVIVLPLRRFLDGEGYEGRALPGPGGRTVHYWHLPEATVWGISADLLALFLRRAYGWQPPRAPRIVAGGWEFVPQGVTVGGEGALGNTGRAAER